MKVNADSITKTSNRIAIEIKLSYVLMICKFVSYVFIIIIFAFNFK